LTLPRTCFSPTATANRPTGPRSQQIKPTGKKPPYQVTYGCKIEGHEDEQGVINVFSPLAFTPNPPTLASAIKGTPIVKQQVVTGGMSPYAISGQLFQITEPGGNVIQSGSGIGPGLQLNATADNTGIWVTGTPTVSGTYNFTFTVNDAMGKNLQQVQYTMKVA
jgi:hypothetical protein